ncbi:MAG TPA: aminoglycoside phosphotransferase family protein [Stellaceae bacterium]|nr:aminoglycoside phosphotransferase family protein [Stellaceae bacterium]
MGQTSHTADRLNAATIVAALRQLGIAGASEFVECRPLEGGVSSDIWLAELPDRTVCIKRALPRLKVAQLWEAPVARNQYEWEWFCTVQQVCPAAVPPLLGRVEKADLFVMGYLDPRAYPLWKTRLREGDADPTMAAAVGDLLARIHRRTAGDRRIARQFANDAAFHAIRLEPYLLATAQVHPDLAPALERLARITAETRLVLVHGDVSPKNILVGPQGPVFLDAECAWYGDPAFDLAFCLNHLLLKCLWIPGAARGFLACFDRLAETYLAGVEWEPRERLEMRTAQLLPGLFLARVDGKSPVEYITAEPDKARVRRVGRALLARPVDRLSLVRQAWEGEIGL